MNSHFFRYVKRPHLTQISSLYPAPPPHQAPNQQIKNNHQTQKAQSEPENMWKDEFSRVMLTVNCWRSENPQGAIWLQNMQQ